MNDDDDPLNFETNGTDPPIATDLTQRNDLRRRAMLVFSLLGLGALLLSARLIHVQWICRDQFASRAMRQQISDEEIPARPGDILDRQGRLLATTINVPSLFVDPANVSDPEKLGADLAEALDLDRDELTDRLRRNAHRRFLWIKRRLTAEELARVEELKLSKSVAGLRSEFQRHYPQGKLAAHVLGIRNIDGVGRGGVEETFDSALRGRDGVRRFVRDARGFVLDVLEEVTRPPEDGVSVVLTIDILLQWHVEQELDRLMADHEPFGCCAIVMDPRRGEILAMASRPSFNPCDLSNTNPEAWKNLATAAVFEPGSTFKPLVVAWALDSGKLQTNESFDCENGAYRTGTRLLRDTHPYGTLSLTDVLVKSSNIGMAKVGERLGNEELNQFVRAFGFGQKTGIELPGETSGIVRPFKDWDAYSTGSIPMGQEIATTPLQLLSAHAILANGGRRVSPHLLLTSSCPDDLSPRVMTTRVVSVDSAKWLVEGPLREVVQRGTARAARIEGLDLFGKTGTAQKLKEDGPGYSSDRHYSSIVLGAPADAPRLLLLIGVDEPTGKLQYGGSVAGPYASRMLQTGLRIIRE